MKRLLFILLFLFNSIQIMAQTGLEAPPPSRIPAEKEAFDPWADIKGIEEPDHFQNKFMNMLLMLGLLVGFMLFASWTLKRMMKSRVTQMNQDSRIKVLETRHLSPKSLLYLVEVDDQTLLISESSNGVTHLSSFPSQAQETGNGEETHRPHGIPSKPFKM